MVSVDRGQYDMGPCRHAGSHCASLCTVEHSTRSVPRTGKDPVKAGQQKQLFESLHMVLYTGT